jgi:AcrR family transcriptional regulator
MEEVKTKKSAGKKTPNKAEVIKNAYLDYLLSQGKTPASVYAFVKEQKMSEDDFYEHYTSFDAIEKEIWKGLIEATIETVVNDPAYGPYSAREKMLAFFFTLIEKMKSNRSYISMRWPNKPMPGKSPAYLADFKSIFMDFINDILNEGKESGEIIIRPYISERYDQAAWLQVLFIVDFWIKDSSRNFEATDAAIEKSVNLAFDLFGQNPLDSMIDFGKFLFQNRK